MPLDNTSCHGKTLFRLALAKSQHYCLIAGNQLHRQPLVLYLRSCAMILDVNAYIMYTLGYMIGAGSDGMKLMRMNSYSCYLSYIAICCNRSNTV